MPNYATASAVEPDPHYKRPPGSGSTCYFKKKLLLIPRMDPAKSERADE